MAAWPDGTLMQRAATGLAVICGQLLGRRYGSRAVVLAGSGDNGGDALYAGAQLARRGTAVLAVAAACPPAGLALWLPDGLALPQPAIVMADTAIAAAARPDLTIMLCASLRRL